MQDDTEPNQSSQHDQSAHDVTVGPVSMRELILARGLLALMRRHGDHGGAELAMMRHATGGKLRGHRNYYCAPVGTDNRPAWLELVAAGLACQGEPPDASNPGENLHSVFHVTPAGFAMLYGRERGAKP